MGSEKPYPGDLLFVESEIYRWRIFDELSIAAYWTGRYEESRAAAEKILHLPLDPVQVERVRANLDFALQKLG